MQSYRSRFAIIVFAATLSGWATDAGAQSTQTTGVAAPSAQTIEARLEAGVRKLEAACGADVKKFCGQVTPGEGRLTLCMMAHEDQISPKCDLALYEASHNLDHALNRIEEASDACWADIEKHCSNIAEGGGRVAQCLTANKSSLSQACQSVVTKLSAK